jgi:hypothetical protein
MIKVVKQQHPRMFEDEVNALVEDGYQIFYQIVVGEASYVWLIAMLQKVDPVV